jgi:hypothetical protein
MRLAEKLDWKGLTHFIEDHNGPRGLEDGKPGNRGSGCCDVSTWRQLPHLKDFSAFFFNRTQLKCDGTRAETRFRLSAKRTSPFKSSGASVQSTTGSRGVRISDSNGGYTMFRGSVKCTGYPLHSPVFPSLLLPGVTVCHHILTGLCHHVLI